MVSFRDLWKGKNKDVDAQDDHNILAEMGYSQELLRGVTGWFMNFAFTFTAVSIISSYSILFGTGLTTGGPTVMVWGWVIGSFFTILVGLIMAEICSTYPSAGSVYHWAGQLASKKHAPFFSYITGWFNFLGNAAGDASFASGFAQIVAAAAALGSNNVLSNGAVVGISILVLTVWSSLNILRIDQQGWLNNFAAVYQLASSIVIVIVVLAATDSRSDADFVFTDYHNETGFNSTGYVCLIGLLTTLFTFSGYEAGGHIAEETQGARKAAPRGIVACCFIGAAMGIVYILGLLFATPSVEEIMNGDSDAAIVNLYAYAAGNKGGLFLTSLLIINLFFAGMSSVTVTSRITFAMARDGAFPGSKILYHVSQKTKSPMRTVFLVWALDCLLLLLPLVNVTAFNAIVSLTTIGFQISYAIPIYLRVTDSRNTFQRGEFHLGRWSLLVGWLAAIWLTFTSILFFWPVVNPVDSENMNYTCVVVGAVMIIALFFWVVSARKWFVGPKRKDDEQDSMVNMSPKAEDSDAPNQEPNRDSISD